MKQFIRYWMITRCKRANLEKTLHNIEKEGEYSVRTVKYLSITEEYELVLDSLEGGFYA